jgi:hypothetical protein
MNKETNVSELSKPQSMVEQAAGLIANCHWAQLYELGEKLGVTESFSVRESLIISVLRAAIAWDLSNPACEGSVEALDAIIKQREAKLRRQT